MVAWKTSDILYGPIGQILMISSLKCPVGTLSSTRMVCSTDKAQIAVSHASVCRYACSLYTIPLLSP